MKKWMVALGTCAALATLPMHASAHGYTAADAALGGLVGGALGGLIGSAIAPYPVYEAPVVVERYAPTPIVVERYVREPVYVERYERPVVVYRGGHRHWHDHDRRRHDRHRRHWDDD